MQQHGKPISGRNLFPPPPSPLSIHSCGGGGRRTERGRAHSFILFFFLWEKKESGFLVFFRPFSPFPPRTRLIGQSLSREGGEKVWKSPLVLSCFYCGNVFFHQMLFISCPKKVLLGEGKTSPPKGTILKVFLSYVAGFQHHVTPTEPLENKKSTFYKPETCLNRIGDKQFHHIRRSREFFEQMNRFMLSISRFSLNKTKPVLSLSLFQVKTHSSDALLFYNSGSSASKQDFVAMEVRGGVPRMVIDQVNIYI